MYLVSPKLSAYKNILHHILDYINLHLDKFQNVKCMISMKESWNYKKN